MLEYMLGVMNINEDMKSQLKMGKQVAKYNKKNGTPLKGAASVLKLHDNPGFRNIINQCNDLEDLKYLREDTKISIGTFKLIKERIEKCKKLGECTETKKYYKGIKKKYLDEGITPRDCDLTIKKFEEYKNLLNDKIKKLGKD